MLNLKMNLRYKNNKYVLEKPLTETDHYTTTLEEISSFEDFEDFDSFWELKHNQRKKKVYNL